VTAIMNNQLLLIDKIIFNINCGQHTLSAILAYDCTSYSHICVGLTRTHGQNYFL
jgi:hypothetical protein